MLRNIVAERVLGLPEAAVSERAMDFDFNDEQREIKSTAHDFLASRFKPEKVRELAESESPYDDALWSEICELGWPGIAIAEEYGGQGLGVVELVILQEELGYACAPSPLISNALAGLRDRGRRLGRAARSAGCPGSPPARRAAPPSSPPIRSRSSAPPGAARCSCSPTATARRSCRDRGARRSSAST